VGVFVPATLDVKAWVTMAGVLAWLWLAVSLLASPPVGGPAVTLRCPASQGTGRVRCSVEAVAQPGSTIAWADVVIVATPAFAAVLRGRLAPDDAIDQTGDRWRWEFALAARTRGRGEVTVRVRSVVCVGASCAPRERDATATLIVGE
jgi:hypothetical protein